MSNAITAPVDTGKLVSGEAVELDVRIARIGSRSIAFGLDFALALMSSLIFAVVLLLLSVLVGIATDAKTLWTVFLVGTILGLVIIPATIETLSRGRSAGKAMMGLRVVREDGGPIRFRQALIRSATAVSVEFPGLMLPGLSWLICIGVMLIHPSGKRLGDLAAGTIVVHERMPIARVWKPTMPAGLAEWAHIADLAELDDDLALAIRHFLARNHEIAEPARTGLGLALANELQKIVVPPPPPGTPGWAFLSAILAERYRRSAGRMATSRAVTAQVWDNLYGNAYGQPHWVYASPPTVNSVTVNPSV